MFYTINNLLRINKLERKIKMKASEIIIKKLKDSNNKVTVKLLKGDEAEVVLNDDNTFSSNKLGTNLLNFSIFDEIVDYLISNGGKAIKGSGRVKKGELKKDTIMFQIATDYYGKKEDETTFDPLFVVAAILDWAQIAGYIELKNSFDKTNF